MNPNKVATKSVSLKPNSVLLFIDDCGNTGNMGDIQLFHNLLSSNIISSSSVDLIKKLKESHMAPGP